LKNNKQKSENKIQKYTKHEKNNVFPLTRATLIKNYLNSFLVSFLNKHCKKECVHCRNYGYIIVKKFAKYNFLPKMYQPTQIYLSILAEARHFFAYEKKYNFKGCCLHMSRCNLQKQKMKKMRSLILKL